MMGTLWWDRQLKVVNAFVVTAGVLILIGIALVIVDVCIRTVGLKPPGFTVATVEYILLYFVLLSTDRKSVV